MRSTIIFAMILVLTIVFCSENVFAQWADNSDVIDDSFVDGKTLAILAAVGAALIIVGIILVKRSRDAEDIDDELLVPADSTDTAAFMGSESFYLPKRSSPNVCSSNIVPADAGRIIPQDGSRGSTISPAVFLKKEDLYLGLEVQF
jgi:hypothetical protein